MDTFLIYCPHREDYAELLDRLSSDIIVDEASKEPVRLRMGVYPFVDKKTDIGLRFENAKSVANAAKEKETAPIGFYSI